MAVKSFEDVVSEISGKKILVANRGIPARRVLRSIRERFNAIGVLTVTNVDLGSPAVSGAQELILLGDNHRAYLDIDTILAEAKAHGVAAIHPGWGFASEDSSFPRKCKEAGILFIGPPEVPMLKLGNKVELRTIANELGVPTVPGSEGAVSIPEARQVAKEIGFPVMLKAEGGGGGRGIYEVYAEDELEDAFEKASALAQASFGNSRLYVERLLRNVRHIEIQVIADRHGNVFAFDERDCSVQRNHQKLVEITPSPWKGMTEELRERLKGYSEKLVRETGYYSLCTVEFLVEDDGTPYLIEANTRLQVEHGITECRYGIDLVEEQIAVAFGAKLRLSPKTSKPFHACLQVRVNCEDPSHEFTPNAGVITRYVSPGGQGIRLDSCISAGYEFPSQYDSAGALLMAYGRDWPKVLGVMERALREYRIGGVKTTIPFHNQIIRHPKFRAGEFDTKFVGASPELFNYSDEDAEFIRLSRLVAEISAKGYNPYVQLGVYRGRKDKRLGRFQLVKPPLRQAQHAYPSSDRGEVLDFLRDSQAVHFVDTTTRDITQSNSGNRFRLAEDALIGPYLDECGFFSLETGGGAHFHVAMMANMTYPFTEAIKWNRFAPKTFKQILIRSTNVLGYKPQPRNLMKKTGEMICENFHVIRCFDFLNHIENMEPFAEVALANRKVVFQPALSLSWAAGFDVEHYLNVVEEILAMVGKVAGVGKKAASKLIILGLKDMAGVCPPRFITALVAAIRKRYPSLVLDYHRHFTDGLFVPSVAAAAKAGAHIVDVALGASVRWYGQGDVQSMAAYLEEEMGLKTLVKKDVIRDANFVLKQIMPYYDRYTAPYFRGIDHDVVHHGMPGGATSSSQEGAMKQGYIQLLPYMLRFLAGTRKIVRYHDVTPGSQITWNTSFLAITGAYKRGGERTVLDLLETLEKVATLPEEQLDERARRDRLDIYADCNDAFRQLLLGKFGRLPLGFPPDWVYESAFGPEYKSAIASRTTSSPLTSLPDADLNTEFRALHLRLERTPTDEEFVMYLNHPGDALKTIEFKAKFGDPNCIPLDVWFEGLEPGQDICFEDSSGKLHTMSLYEIGAPDAQGMANVRYTLDAEIMSHAVKVAAGTSKAQTIEMAAKDNPYEIGSPCNGDLWVMHAQPGRMIKKGEELFNISVMKQEKSVLSPVDGMVKRVLKAADFRTDKRMVPVKEGELLVELAPVSQACPGCNRPCPDQDFPYCPFCGLKTSK